MGTSNNEETLFAAALALPAVERHYYLSRACGEDAQLRERLQELLAAFGEASSFVNEQTKVARDGIDCIGPYRLLQELGEGGCGIAYLAEQSAPVKRQVALKVIKPGMDTQAVIARFEAERQMLALMDHPNLAKVFDAGATPASRPYFVMELVRGIKITEYCAHVRASIPERLALFIQVCQAIQHAHHKGIIHRDIKPSNVLVTLHDGVPLAKVIDFGIAKAMQGQLTEHTVHTVLGHFIGTPAYVSPEQTEPTQSGVDTRSDIYSLGVLLYELLTGCTPFDTPELLQAGLERMGQRIREEEPPTPSKRLSLLSGEHTTDTHPPNLSKLARQIQGDLDWIVMRCLEKDRAQRYQTASELILDLQRYLNHEPVTARPPSLAYVVRKFARRHRLAFAASLAGLAFVVFIVVFAITTSIQAQRIAAERERAEAENKRAETVSEFMLEVFSSAEPDNYGETGIPISAKNLLDRAGRRVRKDLSQHPEVRARLLEAIGRTYRQRGDSKEAVSFLREAVNLSRQVSGKNVDAAARAMVELAVAMRAAGDSAGSSQWLEEAASILRRHGQERSNIYARLLVNRARIEMDFCRVDSALKYYEQSLTLTRELFGPRTPTVASVLLSLSIFHTWNDDFQAAERAARESLNIFSITLPKLHPDRVQAQTTLGEALRLQSKLNEASALFENSLKSYRLLYGDNSAQVGDVLDSLAQTRQSQGLLKEAEALAYKAVDTLINAKGKQYWGTAYYRISLASVLIQRGKYLEAEEQLRAALSVLRETMPPDHQYVASAEFRLGEVLIATSRLAEAETVLTASMNRWQRSEAPRWRVARSASALGEALYKQGRFLDAEHYLTESYLALTNEKPTDEEARAKAQVRVVRFYTERGEQQKLVSLMSATPKASLASPSASSNIASGVLIARSEEKAGHGKSMAGVQ